MNHEPPPIQRARQLATTDEERRTVDRHAKYWSDAKHSIRPTDEANERKWFENWNRTHDGGS